MKKLVLFVALLCVSFALFAWNDHDQLNYYALVGQTYAKETVSVEELLSFLEAEKAGLAVMLAEFERSEVKNNPGYPALPANLAFDPSLSGTALLNSFIAAIRVNPDRPFLLFIQPAAGLARNPTREQLAVSDVDMFKALFPNQPFEKIHEGDTVGLLEVLTSASDEPDYGMDIGLYEDNKTASGSRYGMGNQPFGNPALTYGSQAPFHMAFPWEDPVLNLAASWIKEGRAGYRVSQYTSLSRYALATGHAYWAYRFAGWALHYLEDMAQPYHATLMPGKSAFGLLALNSLGSKADRDAAVVLLSNRHLVIEDYFYRVLSVGATGADADAKRVIDALSSDKTGSKAVPFREGYAYDVIARKAKKEASALDGLIKATFPARYVNDPSYDYGADPDYLLYDTKAAAKAAPQKTAVAMGAIGEIIFSDIGMYARSYMDYIRSPKDTVLAAKKTPSDLRGFLYILGLAIFVTGVVFLIRMVKRRKGSSK